MNMLTRHLLAEGMHGADDDWCYGSIQVCAMRVTKLNASGGPLVGSGNGLVTAALVDATLSPEIEEGVNIRLKNACGNICQTFRDCDKMVNASITLNLCQLDAQLIQFLIGGSTFLDLAGDGAGDIIGYQFPATDDSCPNGVSLELWSKAWNGSQQASPAFLDAPAYFHWVFPRTKWQIGDLNFENDFMRVQVNGYAEENDSLTANGPYDDWPADIAAAGGFTNIGGWFLDDEIPTAACEAVTVPGVAS